MTYMLNKPSGLLTARKDDLRPTVFSLLPPELAERLHHIGRLDLDTTGLLLLTDDGTLDCALLDPANHVEKKYELCAVGEMTAEKAAAIRQGVPLGSSGVLSLPAEIVWEDAVIADFAAIIPEYKRQKYLRNPRGPAFRATLTVHEGMRHEVKRIIQAVNCRVFRLHRVSMAGIPLDKSLAEGEYRPLTDDETALLYEHRARWQAYLDARSG